ncbi:hypothetical protein ACFOET_02585 [Parapedobacter deserti]|uniref:Uncharacterized protein n=1 Tax=Parapedobacter deserti TaxID=1912957 RepID=A0ABV7JER6_9SPHI
MAGPKKTNSGRQDDRLWKAVLEHVFRDFLNFFYPDDADLFDSAGSSNTGIRSSMSFSRSTGGAATEACGTWINW